MSRAEAGPAGGPVGYPVCRPVGDRHLTLELGSEILPEINAWVYVVDTMLRATDPPGLRETTPAYSSLLVRYDPTVITFSSLARVCLEAALAARPGGGSEVEPGGEEIVVPVVYGGEFGPDLDEVAAHGGLEPGEAVARHAAAAYRVYMIGFAPGFAYLGGLDPVLATPRRTSPRPRVPAGSVGIAGTQTGVYPAELPGGWQIIGRTPLRLWRPEEDSPALLVPGCRVRFVDAGPGEAGWARATRLARSEEERLTAGRSARLTPLTPGARSPRPAPDARAGLPGAVRSGGRDEAVRALAEVVAAGPLDTVQDGGRWGFSAQGLPESGALDGPALAEANGAAGNPAGAPGIEVTFGGLKLRFVSRGTVALSPGAAATLDGADLPAARPIAVEPGQLLEFRPGRHPRAYLAVAGGGVACPVVLGSRSTYLPGGLGGIGGRALRAGDVLHAFAAGAAPAGGQAGLPAGGPGKGAGSGPAGLPGAAPGGPDDGPVDGSTVVRAVPGPQDYLFSAEAREAFFSRDWRVSASSDRRACLLEGEPLPAPAAGGLSDGTPAGSVQIPPSGLPVVLLADHQTTGGYPKIATVVSSDVHLLARAWPGGTVRFQAVGPEVGESGAGFAAREVGAWPAAARRRVLALRLRGRSHLVGIEETPPP